MTPSSSKPPRWSTPTRGKAVRGGFPDATRREILDRDPWCQIKGPRCEGPARIADHVVNWPQAMARGWTIEQYNDPANGQGVCSTCHNQKTGSEAAQGRAARVAERRRRLGIDGPHPGVIDG